MDPSLPVCVPPGIVYCTNLSSGSLRGAIMRASDSATAEYRSKIFPTLLNLGWLVMTKMVVATEV